MLLLGLASGQATLPEIDIRMIAEIEARTIEDGHEIVHLAPAMRVVPGDQLLYTVEIRNAGRVAAVAPVVTRAIPDHVAYVADSATGPGTDITYSIDGTTFAHPEGLQGAKASEYTYIRWQFKNSLKAKSVAYARFRAVVK